MAMQTKILTRQVKAEVEVKGQATKQTLIGNVGCLALGKPGDIVARSYGPVVKALRVDTETAFGTYVEGKGILVNPNDCAGFSGAISYPFDTKTLKAGQVGSFLVSGACVVLCTNVEAIAAKMRVQDVIGYTTTAGDVCEIEVNGFDNDQGPSSSN